MKSRSLFGPLVLITIGVLWLLALTRSIPLVNLWALAHLVPFVLIAIGVGLLIRGVWQAGGIIFSILVVIGIVLAVVFAPQLGWNDPPNWVMNLDIDANIGGGVTGSGNLETETRSVQGIKTIIISYPSDVSILQGETESLTIEAEDNLLPQLSTKVVNGRLEIINTETEFNKRVNPTKDVQIEITVKDLSSIIVSSAGSLNVRGLTVDDMEFAISGISSVTIEDINVDRLTYVISGVGNTTADGEVGSLNLVMSGLGNFKAENLAAQSVDATLSGAGSATVWVVEELNANISGAGSLDYYGNPEVKDTDISGVGRINHAGYK